MEPSDENGEVLGAFEETFFGEVEEIADGCDVDWSRAHFMLITM